MIHIFVQRGQQNRVDRILISGHAQFGKYGQDIVCAAISAISIGLVNAIETMFTVQVHADDDENGKIDCRLPIIIDDPDKMFKIGLLMDAMVLSLKNVANDFPDYVKMQEER